MAVVTRRFYHGAVMEPIVYWIIGFAIAALILGVIISADEYVQEKKYSASKD
jgi:hypothetical protein